MRVISLFRFRRTVLNYIFHFIDWWLLKVYSKQRVTQKNRGHGSLDYSRKELGLWVKKQPDYKILFKKWALKNYSSRIIPSCDRLDNSQGYSLSRLQLLSWEVHHKKSSIERTHSCKKLIVMPS